jgi:hypothetical protein
MPSARRPYSELTRTAVAHSHSQHEVIQPMVQRLAGDADAAGRFSLGRSADPAPPARWRSLRLVAIRSTSRGACSLRSGLRQRGDLTVWFSEAAIAAWRARHGPAQREAKHRPERQRHQNSPAANTRVDQLGCISFRQDPNLTNFSLRNTFLVPRP